MSYDLTIKDHSVYSIIDTGSNGIYYSALYYEALIRKIFEYVQGETWAMRDEIVNTLCYDFPSLFFMFDNKWIEVRPEDYVVDISGAQDRSLCILLIFPQNTAYHIFGMPLLVNYYTIHEMEEGRIGFAPHKDSQKSKLVEAKVPTTLFDGR